LYFNSHTIIKVMVSMNKNILASLSMSLLLFFAASPISSRPMPKIKGRVLLEDADGWGVAGATATATQATTQATTFEITNTLLNQDGTFSFDTFNLLTEDKIANYIPSPENREVLYYLASIWDAGKTAGNADVLAPLGKLGARVFWTNIQDAGNELSGPISALGSELKNLENEIEGVSSYVEEQHPVTEEDLEFFKNELAGAEADIASILSKISFDLTSLVALSGTLSTPENPASLLDVDKWVAAAEDIQGSLVTESTTDSPLSTWQKLVEKAKSIFGYGESVVVPQNPTYVSLFDVVATRSSSTTTDQSASTTEQQANTEQANTGTEATGTAAEATGTSSGNDHSTVETMGTTDTTGQADVTGTGEKGGGIIPGLGERLAGAVETMV
jgi:hypothetical protein